MYTQNLIFQNASDCKLWRETKHSNALRLCNKMAPTHRKKSTNYELGASKTALELWAGEKNQILPESSDPRFSEVLIILSFHVKWNLLG